MPSATSAAPIPVYLLTGFLGSGKTTLLARLVHSREFADTAVVINEFGEVGLDHVLVGQSSEDDIVLLDSGCLCCASNNSLQETLESLYYRRLRGEIPAFSRIVVETSGLAEPAPLINALASDASIARHVRLAGVITTIDAEHGAATLDEYETAATQLAVADLVVLTKTDKVAPEAASAMAGQLRRQAPGAPVLRADRDGLQERTDLFQAADRRTVAPGQFGLERPRAWTRLAHVLRYGIASHVIRADGPVDWARYAAWVDYMQSRLGERLLRVKGILLMEDGAHYAIHGVRHVFSPPRPLDGEVPGDLSGVLVLITRDADEEELALAAAVLDGGA
ncbi:cobalamin biosynthesis protein CobW [Pigmentiphaga sp. NML030171]|uniref:GTP-binding protein n=1 Tax=Pigmentiphaga daeguensis TaxID=414049 RepID=A0ABP3LJS7_9BURK|nr:GTP-binding protein [Pigmentiphaga sp. NML030171]OVZ58414.1 cobalamin biosynthesis protein CobW [Pigmentiphaga sp. NML030171]